MTTYFRLDTFLQPYFAKCLVVKCHHYFTKTFGKIVSRPSKVCPDDLNQQEIYRVKVHLL